MTLRDLLFLVPFFLIAFLLVKPTVTAFDPVWIHFWALLGTLGITTVAWLAQQMFKVVLADERARKGSARKDG